MASDTDRAWQLVTSSFHPQQHHLQTDGDDDHGEDTGIFGTPEDGEFQQGPQGEGGVGQVGQDPVDGPEDGEARAELLEGAQAHRGRGVFAQLDALRAEGGDELGHALLLARSPRTGPEGPPWLGPPCPATHPAGGEGQEGELGAPDLDRAMTGIAKLMTGSSYRI